MKYLRLLTVALEFEAVAPDAHWYALRLCMQWWGIYDNLQKLLTHQLLPNNHFESQ